MENAQDDAFKKFRYREQMERLSVPCPPEDFAPRETIAFRWVFERMGDEQNFVPQYFKDPNYANASEKIQCQALGLSFFLAEHQARTRFEKLFNRIGSTAYETLGKNVAKGHLNPFDGHSNLADSSGHFTFHPFENSAFEQNFVIISSL